MAKILKITMEMSITVVQIAPAETDVGPLPKADFEDITKAAMEGQDSDPSKIVNSAKVVAAEVIEI